MEILEAIRDALAELVPTYVLSLDGANLSGSPTRDPGIYFNFVIDLRRGLVWFTAQKGDHLTAEHAGCLAEFDFEGTLLEALEALDPPKRKTPRTRHPSSG